jgi:nitronate monooxygenase
MQKIRDMLQHALDQQVRAIWLSFGVDLRRWIDFIRAFDATRNHKTLIFVIVNSVPDAIVAAEDWKVDVIVAQGMVYCTVNINMLTLPPT